MKKVFLGLYALVFLLISLWAAKCILQLREVPEQITVQTQVQTLPAERETLPEAIPTEAPTEAPTEMPTEVTTEAATEPAYIYDFTEEETKLLLKLGMAERGTTGCVDCIALVMRTVLNRVEGPKFGSTIKGVIYAQDQFAPAMDGTLEYAVPNQFCHHALEKIRRGWDESQGALYYEWCEGESWHSRNLNLLFQHCDVRFYN